MCVERAEIVTMAELKTAPKEINTSSNARLGDRRGEVEGKCKSREVQRRMKLERELSKSLSETSILFININLNVK